ncbi:MAG: discoidin domain-containing protein [Chloroflexi bacterium]|nr:discoidin domain-containing protein [Chloroflexota bacterium]
MRSLRRTIILLACLVLLGSACGPALATPSASTAAPLTATLPATPAAIATATEDPPPDLSPRPLVWFAPLPPMPTGPGRMFTGSDDFLELFEADASWSAAAGHLHVFKLYGEWVAYHASDDELRTAVEGIRRLGLALAVEAGPLDPPAECGQGIEGFAGMDEGRLIARRILKAGGRIDLIALDEPLFFASIYDGPKACRWEPARVAAEVGEYIAVMRGLFPQVVVGDTEPLAGASTPAAYTRWLETFRQVNGYDLAFLHMDIDWGRPSWLAQVKSIEDFGRAFGVPVGIIYTGNFQDATDEAWLSIAGERLLRYEGEAGGRPEHVLFQSRHDKPDRALPETETYTFTGFVRTYFEDRSALGLRREGPGANLALQKTARVSNAFGDQVGALAVDGDPGTSWNSGGFPLQWIQIDLGADYDLAEIRLTTAQTPGGNTIHVVYGLGSGTGGKLKQLHIFSGATDDSDVLAFAPAEPLRGIRILRIETTTTPSWVGWREIEVIAAR